MNSFTKRPSMRSLGTALGAFLLVPLALGQTLASGGKVLSFPEVSRGQHGVQLHARTGDAADAYAAQPVQLLVCSTCSDESTNQAPTGASYTSVQQEANDSILAAARVTSPNGSTFQVRDRYKAGSTAGTFTMSRTVTVLQAASPDQGFNSQFVLGFAKPLPIERYHFLAPAIWYDKNVNAAPGAFATNYANENFYWRETRSGLPFVMMQDPSTGTALSIAHIDSTPRTGADATSQQWLVNSSVQYGSIGAQRVPQTMLGFIYPADEGDGNYIGNRSTEWVRRSHPVQSGFSHTYTLMLGLEQYVNKNGGADYNTALGQTWRLYYNVFNPPIAKVPSGKVYRDGIALLNHYSANRDEAQGFPFSSLLPDGSVPASQISYLMGYVGEQIPAGFELLRYGVLHGDQTSLTNGKATLDFWAARAAQSSGLPLTWYNVSPPTFRDDDCIFPIFTRTVSDGMEGIVSAAVFMRQHKMPQLAWEKFAQGFGDWLVANQNADGSYYRAYNPDGTVFTNTGTGCDRNGFGTSKFDTTHPVRFLVSLYFATGQQKYLTAAEQAGNYALGAIYKPVQYVGGTTDNPNALDKEGGVEALHAALALYDATHAAKWLTAAQEAANYVETWMYAWNFPISNAPLAYQYAGTQGSSMIATGQSGSDIFLAFEAYDFYRLHLLGDDANDHYLQIAGFLENNTKLTTQVTGVSEQQFGYSYDGLVGEANELSFMTYLGGTSAGSWLPWLTEAEIEPLQRLEDTFGSTSIQQDQSQSPSVLNYDNQHVYPAPGSIGWGQGSLGAGAPKAPSK